MRTHWTRRQVLLTVAGMLALAGCSDTTQARQSTVSTSASGGGGPRDAEPPLQTIAAPAATAEVTVAPVVAAATVGTTTVLSLEVGAAAPALSLVDRAGKAVDLGTFGGRPVLLNFLSTTCAPCAAELPLLSAAQQQYGRALDVVLVGVLDTPDDLATFAADHEAATLSQLIDPHGATARAYHIGLIPSSVFLDAQAQIATTHVGVLDSSSLAAALAKAGMPTTGGGPVTLPATTAPGVPPCCPVPGGD